MHNPRLAGRYAKSLLDLAIEQNQLEAVYQDMQLVKMICRQNPDFVALLKSPVIHGDKKEKILNQVFAGKLNRTTELFIQLLLRKTRESNLPEIANTWIDQYNTLKGIHRMKVSTALPISEEIKQVFVQKVQANTGIQHIELEAVVNDKLIGGFTLELDGNLVDASILRELNDVKKQFRTNEYIHQIR